MRAIHIDEERRVEYIFRPRNFQDEFEETIGIESR